MATQVSIVEGVPSYAFKAHSARRVLVIEDNLDAIHTLVLLLRDMGHQVDYAINGYAGLDLTLQIKPEFVLLDIGLPGIDGYEVCRRIRATPALEETKVVFVTAYRDEAQRERSRAAGGYLHLVKPVPIAVLEELLA